LPIGLGLYELGQQYVAMFRPNFCNAQDVHRSRNIKDFCDRWGFFETPTSKRVGQTSELGLYGRRIVFVQGQNFPFTRNRRMVKTDVETSPP